MKKWVMLNNTKPGNDKEILDILLANRGITTEKGKTEFLNPTFVGLTYENAGLKENEMEKAVKRIKTAIKNSEQITVYTDYDVDGVASGTIIWEILYSLGANVLPYVPHRIDEGYGLSQKGIDKIHKENNTKLIITVDHGVTAWEKVAYAGKLGIDTIILDHHTLPKKLPEAVALVHTTKTCATGIAWFFERYLISQFGKVKSADDGRNLDLIALATIADLVPLTGINRILVKYGLEKLNKTKRVGLLALIKAGGLIQGNIGTYEVGHVLAPRINASGRLTHALDSLRLLCTKDQDRADILAKELSVINRERQLILGEAVLHALESVKRNAKNEKIIFLAHETYNQGVIGLVAGKLTDAYYLPAIVISRGKKYSKASARSISGFNIIETLRQCSDVLVDVGGHPMAAGFTVETDKLGILENRLVKLAEEKLTDDKLQRSLTIDCEINLTKIDFGFYRKLQTLAPFGMGNPQPVFVTRGVKIAGAKLIGRDKKHLKIILKTKTGLSGNRELTALGFGMGGIFHKIGFDIPVDIAYTIDENTWNNHTDLQLKLRDVKMASNTSVEGVRHT